MSRREKLREITLNEIKSIARQQMAESGTAGISLNGIARRMEMSAPALYRYFASRDDLVTALVLEAYTAMADALEAVSHTQPKKPFKVRLLDTILAYREWAFAHPIDFQLIYGNPIPGYQAPAEKTAPAAYRTFQVFLEILQDGYQSKEWIPSRIYMEYPPEISPMLPPPSIPGISSWQPAVAAVGMIGWTRMHGMITLEMFHHTTTLLKDPAEFYKVEMEKFIDSLQPDSG